MSNANRAMNSSRVAVPYDETWSRVRMWDPNKNGGKGAYTYLATIDAREAWAMGKIQPYAPGDEEIAWSPGMKGFALLVPATHLPPVEDHMHD